MLLVFRKHQAEQLKQKTSCSQNCHRTVYCEARTTNREAFLHSSCCIWVLFFLLTYRTKDIFLNLNRQINNFFFFFGIRSLLRKRQLANVWFNLKGVLPVGVADPSAPPRQLTCQNKNHLTKWQFSLKSAPGFGWATFSFLLDIVESWAFLKLSENTFFFMKGCGKDEQDLRFSISLIPLLLKATNWNWQSVSPGWFGLGKGGREPRSGWRSLWFNCNCMMCWLAGSVMPD